MMVRFVDQDSFWYRNVPLLLLSITDTSEVLIITPPYVCTFLHDLATKP